MKSLALLSAISSLTNSKLFTSTFFYHFFRWHGGFRSNGGFALLGLAAIVIVMVLVFQLSKSQDKQVTGSTGNNAPK